MFYLSYNPITQSDDIISVIPNSLNYIYNSLLIFNYSSDVKLTIEDKISILYDPSFNKSFKENILKELDDDIILILITNSITYKYLLEPGQDNFIDFILKYYKNSYNYDYSKKDFI